MICLITVEKCILIALYISLKVFDWWNNLQHSFAAIISIFLLDIAFFLVKDNKAS